MRHNKIGTLLAAIFLASACTPNGPDTDGSNAAVDPLGPSHVATVNGVPIHESIFRLYALNGLQKNADDLTDEERSLVLEDLIRFRILMDAATQSDLLSERRVAAELELARLQIVARTMAGRYLEQNPATEAELRAAYNENLDRLRSTQFKAKHILLESEEDAAAVIVELNEGADFVELAREKSTGPTAPQGGDLGWFTAESMVEPFANAVLAMEPGRHSTAPVRTQFGWHVILVEDRREQQAPGLDAVRAELVNAVERRKLEAYVEQLKESVQVVMGGDTR
jgi:peptidyl-prolyl cis-trans isomerase C